MDTVLLKRYTSSLQIKLTKYKKKTYFVKAKFPYIENTLTPKEKKKQITKYIYLISFPSTNLEIYGENKSSERLDIYIMKGNFARAIFSLFTK